MPNNNNNNPPRLVPVYAHDAWKGMFEIVAAAQGQAPRSEQPAQVSRQHNPPQPLQTEASAHTGLSQPPSLNPRKS